MTKSEEKIKQLQMMEQSMQALLSQKQSIQMQVLEIDSALKELTTSNTAYKILGNVMVLTNKSELEKELNSKKETTELRLKSIDTQEERTRERASALQKEVLEEMKDDSKNSK